MLPIVDQSLFECLHELRGAHSVCSPMSLSLR